MTRRLWLGVRTFAERLPDAWRQAGLTGTGAVVLAGAALAWVVGFAVAGRPLYLLAYGAVAAVAGAWLLGRRRPMLGAERAALPARVGEGEHLDVAVRVTGSTIGTVLLDRLPSALGGDRVLRAGEDGWCRYRLPALRRGAWRVGPVVAIRSDPAGLSESAVAVGAAAELVVHPSVEPLGDRPLARLLEDPPIRPPRPRPWPSGLEFAGAQPYTPGDDLRRVLWRAYARTGELLVREAEKGVTDQAVVVVAADGRFHTPGDPSTSFEVAARAAASLGVAHLAEGFAVTLVAGPVALGPLRGPAQSVVLLDALARLRPDRRPLAEALSELPPAHGPDTHLLVVTPALADTDLARLDLLVSTGRSALVVALAFDDDHLDGLARAPVVGCQMVEVRPDDSLAAAFARHHMGAPR